MGEGEEILQGSQLSLIKQELMKVSWPSIKEAATITLVVMALTCSAGILLAGIDYALSGVDKVLLAFRFGG